MANEISVNASLTVRKGDLQEIKSPGILTFTMNGTTCSSNAVSVATTAGGTLLSLSSLTTAGWAWFRNTDSTNFVQIGRQVSGTFYPLIKLEPGEACVLRLATLSVYALADTAAVVLDCLVVND